MLTYYVNEPCSSPPSTGAIKQNASWNSNGYLVLTVAGATLFGALEYSLSLPTIFTVQFDFWTGGGNGADAVYFYWGCSQTPTNEDFAGGGYVVAFDEYSGDNAPYQIRFNGAQVANTTGAATFANSAWHTATISVNGSQITMSLDGVQVLTYTDTSRTLGGLLAGWGGRTGGLTNEHRVRNLQVFVSTPDDIQKRFYYKVYNTSQQYLTTWLNDVISEPTFRTVINGGPGELKVTLARPFDNFGEGVDVSLQNRVELWVADADNVSNNLLTASQWDSATWDVDVWDGLVNSFVKIYSGYISQYAPVIDDKTETVELTVLGSVTDTTTWINKDTSGNTTVTYTNQDPGTILQSVIDNYRADGGINLNYVGNSIQTTGIPVTYTFQHQTLNECFDKLVELCPANWGWFIDTSGTVYLRQANITQANHILTIGKDIAYLQAIKRTENLANVVYVVGGGSPQLFTKYSRSTSVGRYNKHEYTIQDGTVTDLVTADSLAKSVLDLDQVPETRTKIRIIDNNGENRNRGQDIESFKIGDSIQIKNLKYGAGGVTLWDINLWDTDVWDATINFSTADVLVIVSLVYYPDYIEIEAADRFPEIAKTIASLNSLLNLELQQGIPAGPAVRTV